MEKIKVNMNPNPLDVQTIHASQNDGEAREWEFELHNNGELIDTSNVTEQMFFKAYKGGTEQILPENTSTPTTSPFKGDIRYPQGLLTDQEFLYRESPTESDGLAKITDIKGNTLVWNQLVQNGNFADTSIWQASNTSFSVSSNVATIVPSASYGDIAQQKQFTANHKYFATCELKLTSAVNTVSFRPSSTTTLMAQANTNWQKLSTIFTVANSGNQYYPRVTDSRTSGWDAIQIRNCMVIDLTQMGLDITDPSDFTSLFSLPYYDYNIGTLLSFNGTGLKVTGKNLFNGDESYSRDSAGYYIREGETNNPLPLKLAKGTYTISIKSTVGGISQLELFSGGIASSDRFLAPYISLVVGVKTYTFTIDKQSDYIRLYGNFVGTISGIQIESGSTATPYEPYTESTLSLPISTYFPTGMKSAGNVYDELTLTRIGSVDLGTLNYGYNAANIRFQAAMPSNYKIPTSAEERENLLCAKYDTNSNPLQVGGDNGITGYQNSYNIFIRDNAYTDPNTFKASLSGVYLYYELATPTETSFTTASLVTENGEVALANENGVLVGKCNSDVSADAGFIEGKIKLSDEDGDVYSNKIQIHVERSPQ